MHFLRLRLGNRLKTPAARLRAVQLQSETERGVPPITLPKGMGAAYRFADHALHRDGIPQPRSQP